MIEQSELRLDIHTHTIASGHAYGTIREMAAAAAEQDLDLLGITEHGPGIPGTCDPIYFCNLTAVPRRLSGVEVFHGCEANVLDDGTLDVPQRYLDRLDYAIVGIHLLCYRDAGPEKNTDNLISCMKHGKVCFVSRPDSDQMPVQYERLVLAAKECHVALEVNNNSLLHPEKRPGCVDNYKEMLALCRRHGVPIVVDSDAHDPSAVGRFGAAVALLNEVEFDKDLILNTDAEQFKRFIGADPGRSNSCSHGKQDRSW